MIETHNLFVVLQATSTLAHQCMAYANILGLRVRDSCFAATVLFCYDFSA